MAELDAVYPGYGFASHKGYGVRSHQVALRTKGPCAIHRKSFAPIRAAIASGVDRPIQD
jgi:ribonuclease HII